jgi:hypothetical protein
MSAVNSIAWAPKTSTLQDETVSPTVKPQSPIPPTA